MASLGVCIGCATKVVHTVSFDTKGVFLYAGGMQKKKGGEKIMEKVTFVPPVSEVSLACWGWLNVGGNVLRITDVEADVLTLEDGSKFAAHGQGSDRTKYRFERV